MNNPNAPENLRVKVSTFQTDLTFNEWARKFNVGMHYQEPPQLYQGNPNNDLVPDESFKDMLRRIFVIHR